MAVSRFLTSFIPTGDWLDEAACGAVTLGMLAYFETLTEDQAVEFCQTCPVRVECLEAELAAEDGDDPTQVKYFPVFGGLKGRERAKILRERRPRKTVRGK